MSALLALTLSDGARQTAGILLLAIVAVESGGVFLYGIVRSRVETTPFQRAFYRAGHAHAGVLVILALVVQLYADAAELGGVLDALARSAIPAAAILMPAGFFLSAAGQGATAPNRLVVLLPLGALSLATGAVVLGIGLLA